MRPPSDSPKTTMKSIDDSTGAAIVCVQSFSTRALSRADERDQAAVAREELAHRFEGSAVAQRTARLA